MLFNVESDSGDRIVGYVVPDGFSAVPIVRVCDKGGEILRLSANETRESLVVAGRHETGRCGFTIDSKALPDLAALEDLEIFDAESGILIYRRPGKSNVRKKLIRIETHLFPLWALDNAIAPKFQYSAKGIETLGRESVTQLLLLNHVNSLYLSGRILFKNYAYYVDAGFQTVILLQNPYEELAERLLVLGKLNKFGAGHLGDRDAALWAPVMDFAEHLSLQDERACRRAFRLAPKEIIALLSNPVVRQLTAALPDEMPAGGAVGSALDVLANSAIVGLRHDQGTFLNDFGHFLGIDPADLPRLPKFAPVAPLARLLKESGEVDSFLEKDLEFYSYVLASFNKSPQQVTKS